MAKLLQLMKESKSIEAMNNQKTQIRQESQVDNPVRMSNPKVGYSA
jgi:hypothetical protein